MLISSILFSALLVQAQDEIPRSESADSETDVMAEPDVQGDAAPPEGVEAGSVRKLHVLQEGENVDAISISYGFLPQDVREWSGIEGDGKAGDELVLWVAPIALPEPEPEPQVAKKKAVDRTPDTGLGGFFGVQVGPAFSLTPLGTAATPRLEGGVVLPPLGRSFRVFVSAQYLRPRAVGTAVDDRVAGGSFDYDLKQDELSIAGGLSFRLGMLDGPVKPEVSVGPDVFLYRSTVVGSAGGADFGESTEQYTRLGVYASGGVGVALGPGEVTGLVQFQSSAFRATITGEAPSANVSPTVGYRLLF